jgi:hypothetical protein
MRLVAPADEVKNGVAYGRDTSFGDSGVTSLVRHDDDDDNVKLYKTIISVAQGYVEAGCLYVLGS